MDTYCAQCGVRITSDSQFCQSCGATVIKQSNEENEKNYQIFVKTINTFLYILVGSCLLVLFIGIVSLVVLKFIKTSSPTASDTSSSTTAQNGSPVAGDRIKANESAAVASLRTLHAAEAVWRQQDADSNGSNDYWTFDVSCLYRMYKTDGVTKVESISLALAKADAIPAADITFGTTYVAPLDGTPAPLNGYYFRVMLRDENGEPYKKNEVQGVKATNNYKFAFVAFPAEYGASGKMTFIINEIGVVYKKDTGGESEHNWPGANPAESGWMLAD